jgi:hypothetical protein
VIIETECGEVSDPAGIQDMLAVDQSNKIVIWKIETD